MIMADVLKIVFIILGILLVFVSYWLAAEALFPSLVGRARERYQGQPVKTTLIGCLIVVPATLIGLGLGSIPHPVAKLLGMLIGSVPLLLGLAGSAGLAQRIGLGLPSQLDDQQTWRRMLRGSVVLSLTFLLPVVGTFLVMPWTVISGVGAAVLAMRTPSAVPAPPLIQAEAQAG